MDAQKYNREITLLCPTCGGTQFEFDDADDSEIVKCVSCEREVTKDELIQENQENISENIVEVGREITSDLQKELAKAFGGLKNTTIKL
jgi:hypothetical protein